MTTTETPMRERVINEIRSGFYHSKEPWEIADAVLDAMREPSESVVKCAARAVRDFYTEDGPYARTKAMWKAAIDAAKEEK